MSITVFAEMTILLCLNMFSINAKIQPACKKKKKMVGKCFPERLPDDSKTFIEIALSCTIYEINAFWSFMQKFKMATKNGEKTVFGKKCHMTLSIL